LIQRTTIHADAHGLPLSTAILQMVENCSSRRCPAGHTRIDAVFVQLSRIRDTSSAHVPVVMKIANIGAMASGIEHALLIPAPPPLLPAHHRPAHNSEPASASSKVCFSVVSMSAVRIGQGLHDDGRAPAPRAHVATYHGSRED